MFENALHNNGSKGEGMNPVVVFKVTIGSVHLENPFVLAPLAGISSLPLRLMAKEWGCALVCSEMISAQGLVRDKRRSMKVLQSDPREKPLSVQIFGAEPDIMAEAARIVADAGADILDVNFGCSVKKVVKTGAGAALMREPKRAEAVIRSVRKAVRIPLTLKIRSGWDAGGAQALQIAAIAASLGTDAVTVHPRSANQGFRGAADWSIIRAVKESISIPVIGNGDVFSAQDAVHMLKATGCDAVMIGRGAVGNPWIFSQALDLLKGKSPPPVSMALRTEAMERYVRGMTEYLGEKRACYMLRSRLGWFVKGIPHAGRFREAIKAISSEAEAMEVIRYFGIQAPESSGVDRSSEDLYLS